MHAEDDEPQVSRGIHNSLGQQDERSYMGCKEHSLQSSEHFLDNYDVVSEKREIMTIQTRSGDIKEDKGCKLSNTMCQLLSLYEAWVDQDWQEVQQILHKEWSEFYQDVQFLEADPKKKRKILICKANCYINGGILDVKRFHDIANGIYHHLEGQVTGNTRFVNDNQVLFVDDKDSQAG